MVMFLMFSTFHAGLRSQKTHVYQCVHGVVAWAPDVWRREGPVGGVRSLTPRGTAAR